jgi:carbon monoxide dehydrogenase subunit G
MTRWTSQRTIRAAVDRVFRTVADPHEFQQAIPGASKVEFLTPGRRGVGMRFRATRIVKGKPSTFEQEVTEYVENDRVRMLNVTDGVPWDSTFAVRSDGDATILTLTMDALPERLHQKMMMRLIHGMVQKALEADMDGVKSYCETQ